MTHIKDVNKITLRLEVSFRGGGIEISLDSLGYSDGKMTAYQNYLGGGMLGRVCSDCTIVNWRSDEKLTEISNELKKHYHSLTNHDDEFESTSYVENQILSCSAY